MTAASSPSVGWSERARRRADLLRGHPRPGDPEAARIFGRAEDRVEPTRCRRPTPEIPESNGSTIRASYRDPRQAARASSRTPLGGAVAAVARWSVASPDWLLRGPGPRRCPDRPGEQAAPVR